MIVRRFLLWARTAPAEARASGAAGQTAADIALAVSEAVSNVVLHAYRELARPGLVSVEAEREGDALRVLVRDDGPGIAPRADSPGLGIGLSIIAHVTQVLELRTRPEGGAELCMVFHLA